jgi:hypothetical protein
LEIKRKKKDKNNKAKEMAYLLNTNIDWVIEM